MDRAGYLGVLCVVVVVQVLLHTLAPAGLLLSDPAPAACASPRPRQPSHTTPPPPPPPPPTEFILGREEACELIGGCFLRPKPDAMPKDPDTNPFLYFNDYEWVTQEALVDLYRRRPSGGVFLDAGAGMDATGVGGRSRYAGQYEYHRLDARPAQPGASDVTVITCDLHDCGVVPDGTYDVVFLRAVFEHLAEPWRAVAEVARMLKPGGLVINICFMSTRWHMSNEPYGLFGDQYRYTHNAFMHLHEGVAGDVRTLDVGYDIRGRRMPKEALQRRDVNHWDWAPKDDMGGWTEIWTLYYVGEKVAAPVQCGCDYCLWRRGEGGQAAMKVPHKYVSWKPHPAEEKDGTPLAGLGRGPPGGLLRGG